MTTRGTITEFTLSGGSAAGFGAHTITTGPDGKLWLTDYDSTLSRGSIVSITTTGKARSFAFPTVNEIDGITPAPAGSAKMWFTSTDLSSDIGSVGNISTS